MWSRGRRAAFLVLVAAAVAAWAVPAAGETEEVRLTGDNASVVLDDTSAPAETGSEAVVVSADALIALVSMIQNITGALTTVRQQHNALVRDITVVASALGTMNATIHEQRAAEQASMSALGGQIQSLMSRMGALNASLRNQEDFAAVAHAVAPVVVARMGLGASATCAVLSNGTLRCWGRASGGALGNGDPAENIGDDELPASAPPVDVGFPVRDVAVGHAHACAISTNGSLVCFGSNYNGELGLGHTSAIGDDEIPAGAGLVPLSAAVLAVVAGNSHTCALLASPEGAVQCWGRGETGVLGLSSTATVLSAASSSPANLGGKAVSISSRADHNCAVLEGGAVVCWGLGSLGRLGYGNTDTIGDDEHPVAAGAVPVGENATSVQAGGAHTCIITRITFGVRCWGWNGHGQLGKGSATLGDDEPPSSAPPVRVGGVVESLALGDRHTCALLQLGSVVCWGGNEYGQLGLGHTRIIGMSENPSLAGVLELGGTVRALFAGALHTCAIMDHRDMVRCWGYDGYGQLGHGDTFSIGAHEPASSAPLLDFDSKSVTDLAAGHQHTCAVLDNMTAVCWGRGDTGALGTGFSMDVGDNNAAFDFGEISFSLEDQVAAVACGHMFACVLDAAGHVLCWGQNDVGQLGQGDAHAGGVGDIPSTMDTVALGGLATAITAQTAHACALLSNGSLVCWGLNMYGQLGYGHVHTIGDDERPVDAGVVPLGATVVSVGAGGTHTCAVLSNHSVSCWGAGGSGRLGYGSTSNIGDSAPAGSSGVVALGDVRVTSVALGAFHTCALTDEGQVLCWGDNGSGQLGTADTGPVGDNELPTDLPPVPVGAPVARLVARVRSVCAVTTTDALVCWGADRGKLGYGTKRETTLSGHMVPVGGPVRAVALGSNHMCARFTNGSASCWGQSERGQLGYGRASWVGDNELPTDVPPVQVF